MRSKAAIYYRSDVVPDCDCATVGNENVTSGNCKSRITPRILSHHLRTLVKDGCVDEKGRDVNWKLAKRLTTH